MGSVDKLDLLLVVDNSRSMADKQAILAAAVPDLVRQLVDPRCVDELGEPAAEQPSSPLDPCPTPGTGRLFEPFRDVHVGVLTSSIGGHGADACDAQTIPSEIVKSCPATERRTIRFVGQGQAAAGATLFISCQDGGCT
jgi:hypothetical protein